MSRSFACALLLSFAALPPLQAQTGAAIAADKPLALEDAIGFAVRKNFNLQIQANSVERQKDQLEVAKSIFDPSIGASFTKSYSKSAARTSLLEGTADDRTSFGLNASQLLPWTNGTLSLSTAPNLSRAATNNSNDLFNPAYNFGVGATLRQPLLRNFGPAAAKSNIERTKIGVGLAYITYKSQVLNLIRDTETAYYALVSARETLRIRESSLTLAQRLFDENSARRSTGVMTDLDVLSAEVGVANARRGVIQAEESVRNAEENLLNLINVPEFDTRPGPVKFEDYTESAPNLAQSYKLAREFYPSTLTETETLRQLQIDLDTARRNLRPTLDLNAGLGYTARVGNESYSDTVSNLIDEHGNNWSIGLSYSMPWGRRADRARFRQAQLDINSQKLRIDQAEQQLSVLVRQAVRSVETSLAAVEIASKATELAARQYDQQKARFDAGLTTSRQVLQFQDDLENARFQELSAKLTLRRAASELRRLEGTSIQRYRVQLPQ